MKQWFGKWFYKILGWIGMAEGVIHIVVGLFSLWGASSVDTTTMSTIQVAALFTAPYENLFFGVVALTQGLVIHKKLGQHHH